MSIGFVFPGQGSQIVGMGRDLAEAFPEARLVFEEVDESIGKKLSNIIWNGPEEELISTVNAQPALMAVSMAFIRVMESCGLCLKSKVAYVAGHSLGEYSALCAAKSFSLEDTAKLLSIRGQAMQEAVPVGQGAMAAVIGLDYSEIEDICKEETARSGTCQVANDNGNKQFVISGLKLAVERAMATSLKHGAKRVISLPVSGPFHSSLMEPAAEIMYQALDGVHKKDPIVPLISNVRAEPVYNIEKISELLVEQITGRVRWRETIEWFSANNVMTIYEIGAGKVLIGLAKRINPSILGVAVNDVCNIDIVLKSILG
ncbi:Malonyl CoA-acyl carrier protein transacylase [Liberibacter crescens BT-1]|uniref:Malonyl CoA-acyl carrier protein transacylase n=1 Tax=Liberibacter crescens (strain BT-1) TaxID=1215343 RepID=L0EVZ5_LIBCB|nr:ACP S-malonyltransferase [Liberibacter crescens]AGA65005.1 Malonyl CoA-acyl carrier protein transacylase [Liberibacter crescens BT-1]AMC13015.1 ACP S-malonyltransferase [Liberibacter crescens]